FPVHPRTRRHLAAATPNKTQRSAALTVCDPLGYLEFVSLWSRARLVLTDSGGLQEESTALGIPCLTLRENTERPITIEVGTNILVGTDPARILAAAERALAPRTSPIRIPELWDGKTAPRIVEAVRARL